MSAATATAPAKTRFTPTRIAPETFLIHDHQGEGEAPVSVGLNSVVIRGSEPVVVDTGIPASREQYLDDVFSIVEPEDIRWIFISHDDIDHIGNVATLMDLAPNATMVSNWFMIERQGDQLPGPPSRWRWVDDGEAFDAGDRRLVAMRPPVYDSPTTRGLFDPTTGLYWASDSFATPMLEPVVSVAEMDPGFWTVGFAQFHQLVSPWYQLVDDVKYQRTVDRVEALGITVIAGTHTPVIETSHVGRAFEMIRNFASVDVPPSPGQAELEAMLRSFEAA